ncbi:hypothetical protein ACF1BE_26660 [Streptomyces sp. NPDC014991]
MPANGAGVIHFLVRSAPVVQFDESGPRNQSGCGGGSTIDRLF